MGVAVEGVFSLSFRPVQLPMHFEKADRGRSHSTCFHTRVWSKQYLTMSEMDDSSKSFPCPQLRQSILVCQFKHPETNDGDFKLANSTLSFTATRRNTCPVLRDTLVSCASRRSSISTGCFSPSLDIDLNLDVYRKKKVAMCTRDVTTNQIVVIGK
jgi:hypothetical protein